MPPRETSYVATPWPLGVSPTATFRAAAARSITTIGYHVDDIIDANDADGRSFVISYIGMSPDD